MNNKNYFFTGITELLILAILKESDAYVYEIVKKIRLISNDNFSISQNTIYASMYKLEKELMVSEYSKLVGRKRTRIYYHIEPIGLNYFNNLLNNYLTATQCVQNILSSLSIIPQKGEVIEE